MKKYLLFLCLFTVSSFAFDTSLANITKAFIKQKNLQKLENNYENSKIKLLEELTNNINQRVYKTTTINDPLAIVALAVSYQLFLLEVTFKVARDLIGSISPCHNTKDYTDMLNTGFYKTYMRPNVGCMGLIVFPYEYILKNYYHDIYQTLKENIKVQVKNINLSHVHAIELLALRIANDLMIDSHFMKIYSDAYKYIKKEHYKDIKDKEFITNYIARHTYVRKMLQNNVYILSLKKLLNYSPILDNDKKNLKRSCCCNIF